MEKRNKNNHITYIRLGRVDREMEKRQGIHGLRRPPENGDKTREKIIWK
jgi:hypothetical protein